MRALIVLVAVVSASPAFAGTEDEWLAGLVDRVTADLAAGKPLVVQVHVPLCDNSIIPCGNAKLGDGENPDTNLYWATTPGFGLWFQKQPGWKRVLRQRGTATGITDVLALEVYRRTIHAPAAWVKRGVPKQFEVDIVAFGWRGKAIDKALAAYSQDLGGGAARTITLDDKSTLAAGGAAQLIAWVGHNRLMDLDTYSWPKPGKQVIGNISIACHTAAYQETDSSANRVPLLMTRDLLFANAAPLEAVVLAFARGASYKTIRADAAAAYAGVQKREVQKIFGVFTNPSDRRWTKR